ncbi:hypothetical protein PS718_04956 [Pseudomonas fluorescens]|uniref:Uncharacterized protein n=1 Tax=Pseudomonas fluorescens TaxID=294 RepID=A0A5E7EUU9_PSEFL|nr:hypothetical protein [Pseudomonas fluorescens]VVO30705.1 hypothetical protein PS718_04956 [Pseudomonas fluorescens]
MSRQRRLLMIVLGLVVFYIGLWAASQWWEKALANPYGDADISPDGCARVQAFRPYWVLPNSFHPQFHPDDPQDLSWFIRWESPAFFRLYDNRNGQLLGVSRIYDLVAHGAPVSWGSRDDPSVMVGLIQIGDLPPDCARNRPY